MDYSKLTDEELDRQRVKIITEKERREKRAQLPDQLADMARSAAAAGCDRDDLIGRVTDALTE